MFKTAKTARISQNIIQQIRNAILGGELKPGDKLPPEKELADNFHVSKASLREAFRALEALGLLEVRQGMSGGAFVKEVDLETARNNLFNYIFFQNPSISEFTQLRMMLEPKAAEIAAKLITDEDIQDLEMNLQQTSENLAGGPFYYKLDTYFHHRIAEITGNRLICMVIDSLKNAIVNIKLELELDNSFNLLVFEAHKRILEALKKRDPKAAFKEMNRHIQEVDAVFVARCDADSPFVP
ncbi:MAG: FadR family transcriptional regulator [Desulfobacteraceae bacterium]|nr:FadR family transcriptional regulator [Desulfobacteraceae bacterium]